MAKRNQLSDTTEQVVPFLEEGSLEPETDEASLDDEDPLTKKKKKKKAKKRVAKKVDDDAEATLSDDDAEELTQTDALADTDETPDTVADEEAPKRRAPKTTVKRTVLVAKTEPELETRPEPVAVAATPTVALSAEDLLKTMTAAFDKTTTQLREIPVEIAASLEQARDEAEHRTSFVSKLTLGLSAAACVLSLLAVGLAQSTRHKQLIESAPTAQVTTRTAAPVTYARAETRVETPATPVAKVAPKLERRQRWAPATTGQPLARKTDAPLVRKPEKTAAAELAAMGGHRAPKRPVRRATTPPKGF